MKSVKELAPCLNTFPKDQPGVQNNYNEHLIFISKNPNIKVDLTYMSHKEMVEKVSMELATGSATYDVENWLQNHGEKLQKRFHLKAYKLMNHLLMTIDVTDGTRNFIDSVKRIKGAIHLIGIDSDQFYLNEEINRSYLAISEFKRNISFSEINSIHGHDGFLIEFEQLTEILKDIFQLQITT